MRRIAVLISVAVSLLAVAAAYAQQLGTITFPTSGASVAQPAFIRGVLLMHSFEYGAAATAFRDAQRLDPRFAMAYWGEALTYTHQVWNQQNADSARLALRTLAPTATARRATAPTAREQAYLGAVDALYGDGSKAHRDTMYAEAMERLMHEYPTDDEAAILYATALFGLSQGARDVPLYMRAGAIAQTVLRNNPQHPGAAHMIIHAFDDPTHAPLGLYAARAYSQIAPAASHAQHMTTHIFLALGMWSDVVSQNMIAAGPDTARWRAGHYTTWLHYAYLQQGKYEAARALLASLAAAGCDNTSASSGSASCKTAHPATAGQVCCDVRHRAAAPAARHEPTDHAAAPGHAAIGTTHFTIALCAVLFATSVAGRLPAHRLRPALYAALHAATAADAWQFWHDRQWLWRPAPSQPAAHPCPERQHLWRGRLYRAANRPAWPSCAATFRQLPPGLSGRRTLRGSAATAPRQCRRIRPSLSRHGTWL